MEQKRPADIFQELLDYLWNGLGLEEKGWKRLKKGDFKKKMKNGLTYQIWFDRSRYNYIDYEIGHGNVEVGFTCIIKQGDDYLYSFKIEPTTGGSFFRMLTEDLRLDTGLLDTFLPLVIANYLDFIDRFETDPVEALQPVCAPFTEAEDYSWFSVVIKRAGGWRTESYNEFYMEKGNVLEQLPSFHWEKLFELQQSMSQSERLLALSVEFWMSAMDDLQEVLTSEHLFEIIAALQTIGAHKYHDLLLKIMNDDFGDVRFPLDDNQIEQMQPKIEDANRAFWKNKGAEAEFRGAVTNFLITNLDASGHVFEGIDQS